MLPASFPRCFFQTGDDAARRRLLRRFGLVATLNLFACSVVANAQVVSGELQPTVASIAPLDESFAATSHFLDEQIAHESAPAAKRLFRVRGRIDTDLVFTNQDALNQATYGDFGSDLGLRRARIGSQGNFGEYSRYIAEFDLASGFVVPTDVYVNFGEATDWQARWGHFREAFSLEGQTSANTFAFLERAPINLLDPARNWGVGLTRMADDEKSLVAIGIFHEGTDNSDFHSGDGSTAGTTGRFTITPWNVEKGDELLHLGVAVSARVAEQGVIIINQKPQSPLIQFGDSSTSPFIPKITIQADFQQILNTQFAFVNGGFWMQGEWYGTFIEQRGGGPIFYHGCHMDAGYFLTGERREYLATTGALGPVRVNRPVISLLRKKGVQPRNWGAWELTSRFAYADFFDADAPLGVGGQLVGVKVPQVTFGVNWYLADHMRLMFNFTHVMPDEPNTGTSSANIFASRLAIFW